MLNVREVGNKKWVQKKGRLFCTMKPAGRREYPKIAFDDAGRVVS